MSTARLDTARGASAGKAWWARYFSTLRYSLYVITHPFDGFWDLTRENRGSMAAANTIVALALIARVLKLALTNHQFMSVHWEYINMIEECAGILLPLLIWCAANWGLTTLFDGKGTLKQIYMGTAYAITPYVLLQFPLILLSHMITWDEGSFYVVINIVSLLWSGFLIIIAMMMIHDYALGKTLLFTLMSLLAMLIIIFLLALFFSLISDAVGYFVSLYREIVYRLY